METVSVHIPYYLKHCSDPTNFIQTENRMAKRMNKYDNVNSPILNSADKFHIKDRSVIRSNRKFFSLYLVMHAVEYPNDQWFQLYCTSNYNHDLINDNFLIFAEYFYAIAIRKNQVGS